MQKILWADDEIEFLKPHLIFLKSKNYELSTVTNGDDAIDMVKKEHFDAVLLDEMMPGKDGLSTLLEIKDHDPSIKVIMITKSEEESIMEEAIGSKIDDYLLKPINPSQVYMSLKKNLDHQKITHEKISKSYLSELNQINFSLMNDDLSADDWLALYRKLMIHSLKLESIDDSAIKETLDDLLKSANQQFCRFIEKNYPNWLQSNERPELSNDLLKNYVLPEVKQGKKVVLFVFDCLRYDHWLVLESILSEYFLIDESLYYSLLPTATPYSRNAIFSGLFSDEFKQVVPNLFESNKGLNNHEAEFLEQNLKRNGFRGSFSYQKCLNQADYLQLEKQLSNHLQSALSAFVVNFIDIITHSRMESKIIQEIIPNDQAYREVVRNWFKSSPFASIFKRLAEENRSVFITTDHGAIQCKHDVKVAGDRETSENLRFKFGRSLNVDKKFGVTIKDPKRYRLPHLGLSSDYIIAKNDNYFVYPTNYNTFSKHYQNSYQHGGISMEEMILPMVKLTGKK